MADDIRKSPRPEKAWGYYNLGRLIGVEPTRKRAMDAAAELAGVPWSVAKTYMEVHKVVIAKEARDGK